jgi:hypothetical protein
MKDTENEELSQPDDVIKKRKKKSPIGQFFIGMKRGFQGFGEKSGRFFLTVRKDFASNLKKIKASWKNMLKKMKESDPKYRRYKRLYTKLEKMETKLAEIHDDTTEIKLKISEVVFMIEHLMGEIEDIEGFMKKNLGSDWVIIKNAWQQCKSGEISKSEFIKTSLLKMGKRFAGIFFKL